ncbi:MAG: HVO_2523 family zinc finger protein [Halobacteriaceae archaeon]
MSEDAPSDDRPTGADPTAAGSGADRAPDCPRCGRSLHRRHCKYVCPTHGVVMDCADTFW